MTIRVHSATDQSPMRRSLIVTAIVGTGIIAIATFFYLKSQGWNSALLKEYTPSIHPRAGSSTEITEITLQRHGCYGSCPVYTVTFAGDGYVQYVGLPNYFGRADGRKVGTYFGTSKEFASLADWIMLQNNFAEMNEDCKQGAKDTEVVSTTVVIRGQRKTVTVCDSSKASRELQAIYKAIDDAVSRVAWQK